MPDIGKNTVKAIQRNFLEYNSYAWAAFFVTCLTFLAYLPSLQNGFVNWDDPDYIYENRNIRSIDFSFVKWGLIDSSVGHWHPLTWFSLALDYSFWELNPLGYHLTNIFLHSLNTFLVFILSVKLVQLNSLEKGKQNNRALIAGIITALLFGIHPLHVESVAWATERKDVLSALFFLMSLLSYVRYNSAEGSEKRLCYRACLILFILAIMTKPIVISLPIVLLILDFYPLNRLTTKENIKQSLIEKLPFFVTSILSSMITIWAAHSAGALTTLGGYQFLTGLFVAFRGFIFYLTKMVLPFNLSPYYPYPSEIVVFSLEYMGSLGLFITTTLFCIYSLGRKRIFFSAWLYYVITLMPVIGIVQAGGQAAADRYTYIPSLGPFLLGGLGIGTLFQKFPKKQWQILTLFLLALLSVILTSRTVRQIKTWRDSATLWSQGIKLFPGTASVAYNNRGDAYSSSGNYRQAIMDYNKAIEINPKDADAYYNIGNAYNALGEYPSAISNYTAAIKLNPQHAQAYNNRGSIYSNTGNYQEAVRDFMTAVKINPGYAKAYYNLGSAYSKSGNPESARSSYERAATLGLRPVRDGQQ